MNPLAGDEFPRRRFTAEEVSRMVEVGILHEDDPLELIDGELIVMTPQGPLHISLKDELHRRLAEAYAASPVHVRDQGPILASPNSMPEPDLALLRGKPRDYLEAHPKGMDVVLVVELAWTSQRQDRAKALVYARAGVPALWLLDLENRRLEVHEQPSERGYSVVTMLDESRSVKLPELDVEWSVASMLP